MAHRLAWRHRARGRATGDRAGGEKSPAPGVARTGLRAQLFAPRRIAGVRGDQGFDSGLASRCRTCITRCEKNLWRHPQHAAARRYGGRPSTTNSAIPTATYTAITGDGFNYAEIKDYADRIKKELLRVPDVAKVELIGEQDEKIFVEVSNTKVANLGLDVATIIGVLQQQNAMTPAGSFETASDRVYMRVSGDFESLDSVRNIPIRAGGRTFRLGDIANISRGYADPPVSKMRFMGHEALGLGVLRRAKRRRHPHPGRQPRPRTGAHREDPAGRAHPLAGQRPAARGPRIGGRVRRLGDRGGTDRAGGEFPQPGRCAPGWWWRCRSRWCWR